MSIGMQAKNVLDYIDTYGSITSLEAFQELGVTRLSARIYELRKSGYVITSESEKNGRATYSRYKRAPATAIA